jgi:single-strand DNA-binding protein
MNQAQVSGILTEDVVLRYTGQGDPVANGSIKTTEHYRDKDNNPATADTYHKFVMFGDRAKMLAEIGKKDVKLLIQHCKIQHRKYEKDGVDKWITELKIKEFSFEF